jgi:hypothetical protein
MRLSSVLPWLTILASGCVSASWSIDRSARPVTAIAVAPIEIAGDADPNVASARRDSLVDSLRARGYDVRDEAPGIPVVKLKLTGKGVSDLQMHAPDDRRHHIENDLHYYFVAYHVELEVSDGNRIVATGAADSNQDPAPALRALAGHLYTDVPPSSTGNIASR